MEIEEDFVEEATFGENLDSSWNATTTLSVMPDLSLHLKKFRCRVDLGLEAGQSSYQSAESDRMLVNRQFEQLNIKYIMN